MLTKLVNGVRVEMSADEEAQIRAQWATEQAKPPRMPPPDPVRLVRAIARRVGLSQADIEAAETEASER